MFTQAYLNRSVMTHAVSVLAALAVALSALAVVTAPAQAADCQARHIVQRGETLYRIGLKYGMTWDHIARANGLSNADRIYAGQVLCIPVIAQPAPDVVLVLPTDVQYVLALSDVNMRVGPGTEFAVMGKVFGGQIAKVTGISANGLWWRVICPNDTVGNCWISAGARYTQPTSAPGNPPPSSKPGVIPTFTIAAVVRDQTVTLHTANFPAHQKFDVRMGRIGTQGVNGLLVTTTDSGQGGSFSATYTIPAELRGQRQIAIRLESKSGHYAYNWFYNTSTR